MKIFTYLFVWLYHVYSKRERAERITITLLAHSLLIQLNILSVYFYYSFENIIKGNEELISSKYNIAVLFFAILLFNYLVLVRNNRYLDYYENIFKTEEIKKRKLKSIFIIVYIISSSIICIGMALYGASLR